LPEGDLLLFAGVDTPALLAAPASALETGDPITPEQIQQLFRWEAPMDEAIVHLEEAPMVADEPVQAIEEEETVSVKVHRRPNLSNSQM
jgi:hypothetical protein